MAWGAITADYLFALSKNNDVQKRNYYTEENLNKELTDIGKIVDFNYEENSVTTLNYVKKNKEQYYMKIETNGDIKIIKKIPIKEGVIIFSDIKWENEKASIEMTTSSGHKIQYQINNDLENGWTDGTKANELELNDVVYARLWDVNESSIPVNKTIEDTEKPNKAKITFSASSTDTVSTITAKVEQTDSKSGVKIEECRWAYDIRAKEIGENQVDYSGKFVDLTKDIELKVTEPGTYYLHVLTVDKAGNKMETISTPVTINYKSAWERLIDQGYKPEEIVNDTSKLNKALENEKDIEYVLNHTTDIMPIIVNNKEAVTYIANRKDVCNKIFGNTEANIPVNATWVNAILKNSNAIAGLDNSNPTTVPNMTGYTTPSGEANASSYKSSTNNYAWKAFNNETPVDTDAWHSDDIVLPQWIQYKFDKPVLVYKFYMRNRNQNTTWVNAPKDFSLSGSNDGINWDVLGNYQNNKFEKLEETTYTVQTINKRYTYYRITVFSAKRTDGVTDTQLTAIGRIQFYGK